MTNLEDIRFGQRNPDFDEKDFELWQKVKRLARKHNKQCENSCNGYGIVSGKMYYNGSIDDYAKREYGYNVKSAYVKDDETVFDLELEKIQEKIIGLIQAHDVHPIVKSWKVEFQHDPRGATVKLYYNNQYIELA